MKTGAKNKYKFYRSSWIALALAAVALGCTEMGKLELYSRWFLRCLMNAVECGCHRAVGQVLLPPSRVPTSSFKGLARYIEQNPNQTFRHLLSYPVFGTGELFFVPNRISSGFILRDEWNLPIYRDSTFVRNYLGLILTSSISLRTFPQAIIDNSGIGFSLENTPIYLGAIASRGGIKLIAKQGGRETVVVNHLQYEDSMVFCDTSRQFLLSSTEPIDITLIQNTADGEIDTPAWLGVDLIFAFRNLGPNSAFCAGGGATGGTAIFHTNDPLRAGRATFDLLPQNRWFGVDKALLQPTDRDKAFYELSDCPFPY